MPAVPYAPDQPAAACDLALRRSIHAMDEARKCAVLWFGEIMQRQLYREFGRSSINQYAMQRLGFSKSRTRDFVRLAQQLDALPRVKAAVADGSLGYTKAREIVGVATPTTEATWLEVARRPRRELVAEVKRVKAAAQVNPDQGQLLPEAPTVVAPVELPVRLTIELTPEQEARRAALVERLHKLGGAPTDRAELLLAALAALVEAKGPRGPQACTPPVQIHVHEDAAGRMTVETAAGPRDLSPAESARMRCDAAICRHGGRNTTTIPPRIRRACAGPRSSPLPGARLRTHAVPGGASPGPARARRRQRSRQPGDPVRGLPSAVARAGRSGARRVRAEPGPGADHARRIRAILSGLCHPPTLDPSWRRPMRITAALCLALCLAATVGRRRGHHARPAP